MCIIKLHSFLQNSVFAAAEKQRPGSLRSNRPHPADSKANFVCNIKLKYSETLKRINAYGQKCEIYYAIYIISLFFYMSITIVQQNNAQIRKM